MRSVPAERYRSPAWLARELELVFAKCWLLALHGSELAAPGDFSVFEIAGESILLTRGEDGRARAFFNVCQHRGVRLCDGERGQCQTFRCPYHHWEYALDGRLVRAPGAGPAAQGDDGQPVSLRPVACEERFGFVWVSLAERPPPLDAWLAPVADELSRYRPEEYRLASENVVTVDANWKASVDVNNESYHLEALHPMLLDVLDARAVVTELRGPHSTHTLPLGRPSRDVPPDAPVTPALRGLVDSLGVGPLAPDARLRDVRPAIAAGFRARAARTGLDLERFTDDALARKVQVHVFPNVQLNFLPFSLEVYRHRPHPTEPGRCWFDEVTYVRPGSGPAPTPRRARLRQGEKDLGPVMNADVDLLPRLQAGLNSRGFERLRLTDGEACIAHLHDVLDAWMAAGGPP